MHVLDGGEENEEEQREKAAIRESGPRVPGSRNEGFPTGCVFDTFMLPRNTGEGEGDQFGSLGGDGGGGRQVGKEKNGDECRDKQGRSRSPLNSNSSSLNEMGCREVECGTRDSKEKETARKRTR